MEGCRKTVDPEVSVWQQPWINSDTKRSVQCNPELILPRAQRHSGHGLDTVARGKTFFSPGFPSSTDSTCARSFLGLYHR